MKVECMLNKIISIIGDIVNLISPNKEKNSTIKEEIVEIKKSIELLKEETEQSKRNDVVLMKSNLLYQFNKCKDKDFRTQYDTMLFLSMSEEYFKSGGNSFVEDIKDEFLKLELR